MKHFAGNRAWLIVLTAALLFASPALAATRVFYDGFESGNTNLWSQDDYRNRCLAVTASTDGVQGPYAGTYMARCNSNGTVLWSTPERFETLVIDTDNYTNELFIRAHLRVDQNLDATSGSSKKLLRVYYWNGTVYREIYEAYRGDGGLNLAVDYTEDGNPIQIGSTYWGDTPGDDTGSTVGWHEVEYYVSHATHTVRAWHDGILVFDETAPFGATKWSPFYITSNFEDPHDAVNHVYFDDMEVFTDATSGTPATGSMAAGTVTIGADTTAPAAPSNLAVQ